MSEFNLEAALKVFDDADPSTSFDAIMKDALRALCSKKEEKTYSIGNKFTDRDGDECMLVATSDTTVLMVDRENGERWGLPKPVKHPRAVTEAELSTIAGEDGPFTRIETP